jgi:hypothetical protein
MDTNRNISLFTAIKLKTCDDLFEVASSENLLPTILRRMILTIDAIMSPERHKHDFALIVTLIRPDIPHNPLRQIETTLP